jgi:hypothetical protein
MERMKGLEPSTFCMAIGLGESDSPKKLLHEPFWLRKRLVRFAYSGTKLGTKNVVTIGENQWRAGAHQSPEETGSPTVLACAGPGKRPTATDLPAPEPLHVKWASTSPNFKYRRQRRTDTPGVSSAMPRLSALAAPNGIEILAGPHAVSS